MTVGQITARSKTVAGCSAANITEILANAALTAAMSGDPSRDTEAESYSCSCSCPDPNGEVYCVTFSRDQGPDLLLLGRLHLCIRRGMGRHRPGARVRLSFSSPRYLW